MTRSWTSTLTEPCLWMAAGLINYRLCDHQFDCDHCPLDAALRGDTRLNTPSDARRPPADYFPADRGYSGGHLWVRLTDRDHGDGRMGLDAFAASLIGRLVELRLPPAATGIGTPVAVLRLDSGPLSLTLPFDTDPVDLNPRVREEPDLALTDPYGQGWLIALAQLQSTVFDELLTSEQALERARLDLRLFRRQVALQMLADTTDLGRCMADGGRPLTDLRQILGALRLRSLLHEFVH